MRSNMGIEADAAGRLRFSCSGTHERVDRCVAIQPVSCTVGIGGLIGDRSMGTRSASDFSSAGGHPADPES